MTLVLEACGLSKRYGTATALSELNAVDAGEVVCLLGANGAGKSTSRTRDG